eukprot:TRINITY_DN7739_c0_g1_i2.p1 TRINITY_DN7739_c0_g1~~TRINITY_DN7739_c0_g1_i2.p1  ORF type:complete len:431 (+),score=129.97 TRINITY_DN7739_c0_g1_i2:119-1411(+)
MSDELRVRSSIQKAGLLWKTPFGHASNKWQRRFFMIKDSFLLYYSEKEATLFSQDGAYNTHPKGAIPLGGCSATPTSTKEKPFMIQITHPDFGTSMILLAANSEDDRADWLKWIYDCSKITWRNAQVGDVLAECLRAKSEVRERQRLQTAVSLEAERMALKQERETRAKLLAQIADLEAAQQQALAEAARLRKDAARKAQQLNVTTTVIEQIESTKREIEARAQMLEDEIATSSSHSAAEREQLEMQKAELQATTAELQTNLSNLLSRSDQLEDEKRQAHDQIAAAEQQTSALAAQLTELNAVSEELRTRLKAAEAERLAAEETAQEEREQREAAQQQMEYERKERAAMGRKLSQAEASLERLDRALKDAGVKVAVDFEADVKQLRSFFETVVDEEYWQARKPHLMKEAVTARPEYKALDRQLSRELSSS